MNEECIVFLTAVCDSTMRTLSVRCQVKGPQDKYVVRSLQWFLKSLGHERCLLRVDPEPSLIALAEEVLVSVPHVVLQQSPKESKGSLGLAERTHGVLHGLASTLRAGVEDHYSVKVPVRHPLCELAYRHAAWLRERFHVQRGRGSTAFEISYGHRYSHPLVSFAETVLWREPQHGLKFHSNFGYGIWCGRHSVDNTHLVLTRQGLLRARTIKRLAPSERYDKSLVLAVKGSMRQLDGQPEQPLIDVGGGTVVPSTPVIIPSTPVLTPVPPVLLQPPAPAMSSTDALPAAVAPPPGLAPPSTDIEDMQQQRPAPPRRGAPVTRTLPEPFSSTWTETCPACNGQSYAHNAECRRNLRFLRGAQIEADMRYILDFATTHANKRARLEARRVTKRRAEELTEIAPEGDTSAAPAAETAAGTTTTTTTATTAADTGMDASQPEEQQGTTAEAASTEMLTEHMNVDAVVMAAMQGKRGYNPMEDDQEEFDVSLDVANAHSAVIEKVTVAEIEASSEEDYAGWVQAMSNELQSFQDFHVKDDIDQEVAVREGLDLSEVMPMMLVCTRKPTSPGLPKKKKTNWSFVAISSGRSNHRSSRHQFQL
eukprot:6491509-Amphidinium_carterae.1